MRRIRSRWNTRFGRWVARQGVREVVKKLNAQGRPVTRQAVHHWIVGRRLPSLENVQALQRISGGSLQPSDFTRCVEAVSERGCG